jgi:arylsulfatase A-like enzyme
VENHRVVGLDPSDPIAVAFGKKIGEEPTGKENPELLKMKPSHGHDMTIINGISRIGFMSGGQSARWVDEDMADVITTQAVNYLRQHQADRFFLFFSLHDIHVPRVPHNRFAGKSSMGPRGDVILQADWCVGEILKTLDELKLSENTLVILSSDNGPVVDDGYHDEAVEKLGKHTPAGPLRGGKYSAYEGGTRVPFLVRWPARIKPGTSSALISQIDFPASFASLTGYQLAEADAPDSINILPALLGESTTGRDHLVEHARVLSLRVGNMKYIEPSNGPKVNQSTNTELGHAPRGMLFNLDSDLGERNNLIDSQPEIAKELAQRLQEIRSQGRSR